MPELRKNPLLAQWVAVASERVARLDQFVARETQRAPGPCRFCPGREHELPPPLVSTAADDGASGDAWSLRVVPSKFPILRVEGEIGRHTTGVYEVMRGIGAHEIIIPTPLHGVDLGALPAAVINRALAAWVDRATDLQRDPRLRVVVITHSRGDARDPGHAHAQLLALPVLPGPLQSELAEARAYHNQNARCLFCDLLAQELAAGSRVLRATDHLVAVCPYAAANPFEVLILPRRHAAAFTTVTAEERESLAELLHWVAGRFDAVLGAPPYTATLHQAPRGEGTMAYHWHMEIIPRVSTPAGVTTEGLPVNPVAPEDAARLLRSGAS